MRSEYAACEVVVPKSQVFAGNVNGGVPFSFRQDRNAANKRKPAMMNSFFKKLLGLKFSEVEGDYRAVTFAYIYHLHSMAYQV